MITNPEDLKKLFNGVKEISNSMTRTDAEKDYQKDVIDRMADELSVEKKYVRKLAAIYHKQNFSIVQADNDELETLYEAMTKA
jgi:hypothetical protein